MSQNIVHLERTLQQFKADPEALKKNSQRTIKFETTGNWLQSKNESFLFILFITLVAITNVNGVFTENYDQC